MVKFMTRARKVNETRMSFYATIWGKFQGIKAQKYEGSHVAKFGIIWA